MLEATLRPALRRAALAALALGASLGCAGPPRSADHATAATAPATATSVAIPSSPAPREAPRDALSASPAASAERAPSAAPRAVDPRSAADPRATSAPSAGLRLDRVAALDAQRVWAVGHAGLYMYVPAERRFALRAVEGAAPRDVVAARGAVYVLARGVGSNAGHALVLRADDRGALQLLAAPRVGAAHDPRALALSREAELYVGGALPALARVTPRGVEALAGPSHPIVSLRRLRDDSLVAQHEDGRLAVFRWSEWRELDVESYVDTVFDEGGFSYVVHRDGAVVVGRPGREVSPLAGPGPAGFEVAAAGVLRDGRVLAAARDGSLGLWARGRWTLRTGLVGAQPLAVLSTDPPLVVDRSGAVYPITLADFTSDERAN